MSVAEGNGQAIGDFSHAEGGYPNDSGNDYVGGVAVGKGSHAEGRNTYAVGGLAHASGYGTTGSRQNRNHTTVFNGTPL